MKGHYSSATGEYVPSDLEQYDADQAQNMLDAILGFQGTRAAFMRSGLKALQLRGVEISDKDIADAMGALDDIFSDLLGKQWAQLTRIAMSWDERPSVGNTGSDYA